MMHLSGTRITKLIFALAIAGSITLSFTKQANAATIEATSVRSYAAAVDYMNQILTKNPTTVSMFDLGQSDSGNVIKGLAIGNGAIHNMVVATHHGNEYGSTQTALAFAADLALKPIDGQTIYVIPVLNIGGFN